jgi:hypothetical protein
VLRRTTSVDFCCLNCLEEPVTIVAAHIFENFTVVGILALAFEAITVLILETIAESRSALAAFLMFLLVDAVLHLPDKDRTVTLVTCYLSGAGSAGLLADAGIPIAFVHETHVLSSTGMIS